MQGKEGESKGCRGRRKGGSEECEIGGEREKSQEEGSEEKRGKTKGEDVVAGKEFEPAITHY